VTSSFAAFALIFFLATTTQTIVGFGCVVIALALGAQLFPVHALLAWLVPVTLGLSGYIVLRYHRQIDWSLLLRMILPPMLVGLALGQLLFYTLHAGWLRPLLGTLVIVLAAEALLVGRRRSSRGSEHITPWTFAAGVAHGLFAAGGPLLVYGVSRRPLDKGSFRSTLAAVWLTLGTILTISYVIGGTLKSRQLPELFVLLAILPVGIGAGEWLHRRVDEDMFRRLLYLVLLLAGIGLILR